MKKSLKNQADAMLKKHKAFGKSKAEAKMIGNTQFREFTSVRSYKNTVSTLSTIAKNIGVSQIKEIDSVMAAQYLQARREEVSITKICSKEKDWEILSQKTLDAERKALSVMLGKDLERVFTTQDKRKASRSYTNEQIENIKNAQSHKNKLCTELSRASGLRAVELLTIKRIDEDTKSNARKWRDDRFHGMEGVRYVVTGKGGLKREVLIPTELAKRLEEHRLDVPKKVYDREVEIKTFYDLSGGHKFSESFSAASKRTLGFSHGAHGLRHSYAQERYLTLRHLGKSERDAKAILSQELGHFRPQIVEVYLR
ncbi:MAG: integrase [Pseudoalteromonas sp.]|nr:integrase [Pseudoalteromonas sp.]